MFHMLSILSYIHEYIVFQIRMNVPWERISVMTTPSAATQREVIHVHVNSHTQEMDLTVKVKLILLWMKQVMNKARNECTK